MGARITACDVFDLDERYTSYLDAHVRGNVETLHLGKTTGDLTQIPLDEFDPDIDIVCSGPLRPPWAGQGNRRRG
eukprot:7970547-Alexandrium_andersonii.AAC.1